MIFVYQVDTDDEIGGERYKKKCPSTRCRAFQPKPYHNLVIRELPK